MTRTPLSRSKGQVHQAALLTAVLPRHAAAAVGMTTFWPWGNCWYVAVCSAAEGVSAPAGEERGGGIPWLPSAYTGCLVYVSHIVCACVRRPTNLGDARATPPCNGGRDCPLETRPSLRVLHAKFGRLNRLGIGRKYRRIDAGSGPDGWDEACLPQKQGLPHVLRCRIRSNDILIIKLKLIRKYDFFLKLN